MFGHCSFFKNIWKDLRIHFKFVVFWDNETLTDNLFSWFTKEKLLSYIPFFVPWECWKAHNRVLFYDFRCDHMVVDSKIVGAFCVWHKPKLIRKTCYIQPSIFPMDRATGFSDGFYHEGFCGVGFVLNLIPRLSSRVG